MVVEHQARRKTVTDNLVLEFMRPRPLNFMSQSKSSSLMKKAKPFLEDPALEKLEIYLRDFSYVYGYEFSDLDIKVGSHIDDSSLPASFVNIKRWLNHISGQDGASPCVTVTKKVKAEILPLYGK